MKNVLIRKACNPLSIANTKVVKSGISTHLPTRQAARDFKKEMGNTGAIADNGKDAPRGERWEYIERLQLVEPIQEVEKVTPLKYLLGGAKSSAVRSQLL